MELKSYANVLASLRELLKLKALKDVSANSDLNASERETALREYASKKYSAWEAAQKAIAELDVELAQYASADRDALRSILAWCQPSKERWSNDVANSTRLHIAKIAEDAMKLHPAHTISRSHTDPGLLDFQASVNELMLVAFGSQKGNDATFHGRLLLKAVFDLISSIGMDKEEVSTLLKCAPITSYAGSRITCFGEALIHLCGLATALRVNLSNVSEDNLQQRWFNVVANTLNEASSDCTPTITIPAAMTPEQACATSRAVYEQECKWRTPPEAQKEVSADLLDISSLLSDIMRIVRPSDPRIEELKAQSLVLMLEISRWYAKNGTREPSAAERADSPLSMRTIYLLLNSWAATLPKNSPPLLKCAAMLHEIRKQLNNEALSVEAILCQCSGATCHDDNGQTICRKLIPDMESIIKGGIPAAPQEPFVCRTKNDEVFMMYCGQELKHQTAELFYANDVRSYLLLVARYWQAVALRHASAKALPTTD